jgi:hypothetical protein
MRPKTIVTSHTLAGPRSQLIESLHVNNEVDIMLLDFQFGFPVFALAFRWTACLVWLQLCRRGRLMIRKHGSINISR